MARPGTRPLPIEEHRRKGNPSRKPLPKKSETIPLPRISPTPPSPLGSRGAALWAHLAALPWVAASDLPAVLQLCELEDIRDAVLNRIQAEGMSKPTPSGLQRHPLWNTYLDLTKQTASRLGDFGLNPAERSRLGLAEVAAKTKLEELRRMEAEGR